MSSKKVKGCNFNWYYSAENGEEFSSYCVDNKDVTSIDYHEPMGHGDKHYCDVYLEDGTMERVFNLNSVAFN